MVPRGLEPRTLWLLAIRSNQLSYETKRCHFQAYVSSRPGAEPWFDRVARVSAACAYKQSCAFATRRVAWRFAWMRSFVLTLAVFNVPAFSFRCLRPSAESADEAISGELCCLQPQAVSALASLVAIGARAGKSTVRQRKRAGRGKTTRACEREANSIGDQLKVDSALRSSQAIPDLVLSGLCAA